jgi:glycosyltransferase involved in cell wall biosynthesis
MGFFQRIVAFFKFALGAKKKILLLRADVIFATSTPLTIAIPAVLAAKKLKIPMVFEVRDLWPELPIAIGALKNPLLKGLARWLERWAYRNSARIVALSPGMKQGIINTGYPPERVHVIPNSCDLELFDVPKEEGDRFRSLSPWLGYRPLVVYAGTFGRINGVGYLVELAHCMLDINAEIRFLVVGDGAEREQVEKRAFILGVLDRNFFFMKPVKKSEMPFIMSAATVATSLFVDIPEMWNNSANKFFDALASGTPVMLNYYGWQADLVRETGAGIVLPPNNPPKAANLLNAFIQDRKRLGDAGASAKQLARDSFSRDQLARDLEQVLSSVVKKQEVL